MKDIDEKIREALQQEDSELLAHYRQEQSLSQMVIDSFRSKHRWAVVLVFTIGTMLFLLEFVVAYEFFHAESIRAMIAWATGFVVCALAMYMIKVWYWLELNEKLACPRNQTTGVGAGEPESATIQYIITTII